MVQVRSHVVGKRAWCDLQPGETQSWASWLTAVFTLTLYCGWVYYVMTGLAIASVWFTVPRYIFLALWSTILLPAEPLLWTSFTRSWVFQTWREYFRYSYLLEEELDAKKKYIFYGSPHGAMPIGPLTASPMFEVYFSDTPFYSMAASVLYRTPVWRHMCAWFGSRPATKENFIQLLKLGDVAVLPGGIAEMVERDRERIKLATRKGFCRVALEAQIDALIPSYYFGQSQVFNFGPRWLERTARKCRVSFGVLYGRWGLTCPHPVEMYLVLGKPVPVPKVSKDDPHFESHVDKLHAAAVEAMRGLYERHKAEYGWADRPLIIE